MPTIKEATLHYLGGNSDKIYRAWIEASAQDRAREPSQFVVNFAFGRRGSRLQVGTKTNTPVPLNQANRVYEKLVNSKIAKGYGIIDSKDSQRSTIAQEASLTKEDEKTTSISIASYSMPNQNFKDSPKPNPECLPVLLNSTEKQAFLALATKKAWVFQEKLDGKRMIINVKEGKATAFNKRGLEIGAPIPVLEEAEIMAQGKDLILDGESIGNNLYVFDILAHKNCLKNSPYSQRMEILEKLFSRFCGEYISKVHTSKSSKDKLELFDRLEKSNKEGVVAKHLEAAYTQGRPNSGGHYLKYKFIKTASAIVHAHNQKHSVALCLIDLNKKSKESPEGVRIPIGNVTIPQSQDLPEIDSIVEVKYLYAMPNSNSLYQPSFISKRDDVSANECCLSQLEYKDI